MDLFIESLINFMNGTGAMSLTWQMVGMWGVAILLLYLGVAKQYEPLLMVPIAFGALIANIPDNGMVIAQMNTQIISAQDGKPTTTQLNQVGYLRVHVAEMPEHATKVPSDLKDAQAQEDYKNIMERPMVVHPGQQLTASEVEEFNGIAAEFENDLVFKVNDGVLVRQHGIEFFDAAGAKVAVDYKNGHIDPVTKTASGKYVSVGQKTKELTVVSIHGGLYDWIGLGIKSEIFPPIIFLGVGALTDFGPLLAAPRTLLLGAAAQIGVAATFFMALFFGFNPGEAASIGIIGGADGPTSIFVTMKLAPHLLGAVAVAAYTYMSLVPLIQPPIMAALTTQKERVIRMKSLRTVSKGEKLFFAILVTIVTILLIPDASPLIGMLMLGNFLRECKVTERLVQASQNEIINIVTIFLGTSVGLTMQGDRFLQPETMLIIALGIVAFGVATGSGVLAAKLMNLIWRKNPVNPLIGSAGVSAVPMAARVSHNVGQKYDSSNYLLMHAMGPNVAGVIGTAVIAGYYISTLAK